MLAGVALREDNIEQVRTLADEARALARDRNDARLEQVPLHMLAVAARMAGDLSSARALYQESIELSRRLSDERLVAVEHHNLGSVELRSYRTARALQLFEEAGVETRRLNYAELFSYLVADLAVAAAEKGDPERAARVVGATSAAFAAKGKVPDPDDAVEQERLRPRLVEALGQEHDSRPPPREAFAAATRRTRRAHSKGYLVAPPQRVGPSRKQRGDRTRDAFREPRHDVDELERTAAKPAPRHVPGEHPSAGELDRGPVQVCPQPIHHPRIHEGVGEERVDGEDRERSVESLVFEPRPLHVGPGPDGDALRPNEGGGERRIETKRHGGHIHPAPTPDSHVEAPHLSVTDAADHHVVDAASALKGQDRRSQQLHRQAERVLDLARRRIPKPRRGEAATRPRPPAPRDLLREHGPVQSDEEREHGDQQRGQDEQRQQSVGFVGPRRERHEAHERGAHRHDDEEAGDQEHARDGSTSLAHRYSIGSAP